jgi:polysaccharide biosynthesis protein PslG
MRTSIPPLTKPSTRLVRVGVALAALASALLLVLAATASAAEKGVMPDLTWGIPDSDFAPTQAAISDLGARWVRLEFRWYEGEPRKGSYNSTTLRKWDKAVATARAAGARIVGMVHRAPTWASGRSDTMSPPANPADYTDFMRFLVSRYRGKVAAWEIWNEQNTSRFWPTGPNPGAYTRLLQAAYPAVKAADPAALVIYGGLAYNDTSFIQRSYGAGAKGYFDAMAVHPYSGASGPDAVWYSAPGHIASNSFQGFREVRSLMLSQGDDKPIWLTEFGWSTTTSGGGVSEQQQANYIARALCVVEHYPYVRVALLYNLRNNFWDSDADSWETQLGLMRTDFSRKPSYYAFRGYSTGACAPAAPAALAAPGTGSPATSVRSRRTTSVVVRVKRVRRRGRVQAAGRRWTRRVVVAGRVAGADGGGVKLRLCRRVKGRGTRVARPRLVRLKSDGSFRTRLRFHRSGRWLLRASYAGSANTSGSASRLVRFRV